MVDRGTINIRRLLSRCVMMTDNQLTVVDAKRLLRFSSVIKEQIEEIEGSASDQSRADLITEVSRIESIAVETIKSAEKAGKAKEKPEPQPPEPVVTTDAIGDTSDRPVSSRMSLRRRKASSVATKLPGGDFEDKVEVAAIEVGSRGQGKKGEQEAIQADMLRMAEQLKTISQQTGDSLLKDKKLISDAAEKASSANVKLAKVNDKLADQITRSGGCWVWSILLMVTTSFITMVIFIKLTNPIF